MALLTTDHQVERQLVVECRNLVIYRKLISIYNPKQARVIFCTDTCSRGTQGKHARRRTHIRTDRCEQSGAYVREAAHSKWDEFSTKLLIFLYADFAVA